MSTAQQRRAYTGPAILSHGFRPFFFFGAAWSALATPLWIWGLMGGPSVVGSLDWHVHEMLFGFLPAIVAGFLTTAVPNWTGRMPVIGAPLGALWSLWLLGRAAMLLQPMIGVLAPLVDSLFLLTFSAVVWREVTAGRNWRNLPVCLMTSLLALANIAFHLDAALGLGGLGARLAMAAASILLALIGGRITPSFTTNWLRQRKAAVLPKTFSTVDRLALTATALAMVAWTLAPRSPPVGVTLMIAGALCLYRLTRWCGLQTLTEPLLSILHLSHAWLGFGLGLLGASLVWPKTVPGPAGVHALTAGAVGVTCLAVMSRASLGHCGRALTADRTTVALFVAINLAAVTRIIAALTPAYAPPLWAAAALFWSLAYGGFALAYGPLLWRRRL